MVSRVVLWKRLDAPGKDACRFRRSGDQWIIEGSSLFLTKGEIANLHYQLRCEEDWSSRTASIRGWIGRRDISLEVCKTRKGDWTLNGMLVKGTSGLLDIDLGFTPASNTNAIRRLDLKSADAVETTAVWLDTEDWTLKPLQQVYLRLSPNKYEYSSPLHGYRAQLKTDDFGVVLTYPGLWAAELKPQKSVTPQT